MNRHLFESADDIANGLCSLLTLLAFLVVLGYLVRAALQFDAWKWMVLP
jgi:hypothetical protein